MSDLEILLISLGVLFVAPYLFIFLLGILPIGKGLAHGPYKKVVNLWYGTTEDGYCYTDLRLFYVYGSLSLVPEEWREAPVINAVAPVINRNCTILKVVFRARVCENETVYFITDDQYKKICSRGRLLGQVMPLPDYKKNRFGYKKDSGMYNLVEESKFKLFGYNVSAKDDYSARYRQTVLMFMIESGLTNKYELLKHIDFNVSNHAHLRSNWLAVTKWEADRQFVSDYSYGSRPIHWVTTSNPPTVEAVYDDYDYQTNGSQSTSQVSTAGSRSSSNSTGQRKSNQQRPKNNAAEVRGGVVRPSGLTAYSVGQRVVHKAFGPGVVTRIDERSNDIYIRFGNEEKMFGLHVPTNIDVKNWFLAPSDDLRSSNMLEIVASEFKVQGLELDWAVVCWDADLRRSKNGNDWDYYSFRGTRWNHRNKPEQQRYLLNSYRVLLTRARQGMVLFVPYGVDAEEDPTRDYHYYDAIYNYLKSCGIQEL